MVEPVNDNILNLVNELYNNLDAKDKIINEQALEISQLKERFERLVQEHIDTITRNEEKQQKIDKAKEYQHKNKEYISKRHKKYNQKIKTSNNILTELEDYLKLGMCEPAYIKGDMFWQNACEEVLDKIQELKEKYKIGE